MEGQIRHFAKIDNHQEDINGKKMKAEDIMGKKMRQIALDVWKLKEPKVLLSVTGWNPSQFFPLTFDFVLIDCARALLKAEPWIFRWAGKHKKSSFRLHSDHL